MHARTRHTQISLKVRYVLTFRETLNKSITCIEKIYERILLINFCKN